MEDPKTGDHIRFVHLSKALIEFNKKLHGVEGQADKTVFGGSQEKADKYLGSGWLTWWFGEDSPCFTEPILLNSLTSEKLVELVVEIFAWELCSWKHPFRDGNRRTLMLFVYLFLNMGGLELQMTPQYLKSALKLGNTNLAADGRNLISEICDPADPVLRATEICAQAVTAISGAVIKTEGELANLQELKENIKNS